MEWAPREEGGFPQSLRESKERPASWLLERFLPGGERAGKQVNWRTSKDPSSSQVLWRMTTDKECLGVRPKRGSLNLQKVQWGHKTGSQCHSAIPTQGPGHHASWQDAFLALQRRGWSKIRASDCLGGLWQVPDLDRTRPPWVWGWYVLSLQYISALQKKGSQTFDKDLLSVYCVLSTMSGARMNQP